MLANGGRGKSGGLGNLVPVQAEAKTNESRTEVMLWCSTVKRKGSVRQATA